MVFSLWENGDGKARKAAVPGVKEKQMQPSPIPLPVMFGCVSATATVVGRDREGWASQAPSVLVIQCQCGLGLHVQFGDPRQLPKVVWDGSIPERLADVPECKAAQAAPWLQLVH